MCSEFRVSSEFPLLGTGASGREGLNTPLDVKASIRIGSTTGGALNSEPSNPSSANPPVAGVKTVLGIGEPATEGVCGSAIPTGIALTRDQKGEKGWEPNDFSRWRTSVIDRR